MPPPRTDVLFEQVLDRLDEAIAIIDARGARVYGNRAFEELGPEADGLVERIDLDMEGAEQIEAGGRSFQVIIRDLPEGHRLLTVRPDSPTQELTTTIILDAITSGQDIHQAAARALAVGTGWRWGAITRFTNNNTWAQVLGWWDSGRPGELFEYPMVDAPCHAVASTGRFYFFQDVARKFPQDKDLQRMGAKTYAGQVYVDGSGTPRGHVFVMHDSYDVDPRAVREILNLIVMLISAEFKILELKVQVQLESVAARTDALTSLFNRKAFDEELTKIAERYAAGTLPGVHLAMIDLDGMKPINDSRGHDEGDRLLQLFARKLCETYPRDRVYRLGGDEFALIFRNSGSSVTERETPDVREDLKRIVSEMRAEDFPESGASGGTADLVETRGDVSEMVRLADQRMYDQKHGRLSTER